MKRLTQWICILLIAAFFFTIPVYAIENGEPRASDYFMTNSQYLYRTSDTSFEICFDVTSLGEMKELGASKIVLERSPDGSSWTEIETYRKSDYPEMIGYDTTIYGYSFPYEGEEGYYYRAHVRYYAKNSSGSAEFNTYTTNLRL